MVFGGAIRRERIYPFRPVRFYGVHVEWKNVENWDPFPSNKPWVVTDVSERINPFPTNTLEDIPFNKLVKFQFTVAVLVEGPRSCGLTAQGS